jgi:hypothetical protein
MPITAILSRTLYEALGGEAAADLVDWMQSVDTHRSELRELNELNYARIDGRMNAMDARFDAMDTRFDAMDTRFDAMDARFDAMDARFDAMDARLGDMRQVMDARAGELRHELHADFTDHRRETQASITEVKLALAAVDAKIDRRYADLLKWSFVFWCGTFAAVALTWVGSMRLLTH